MASRSRCRWGLVAPPESGSTLGLSAQFKIKWVSRSSCRDGVARARRCARGNRHRARVIPKGRRDARVIPHVAFATVVTLALSRACQMKPLNARVIPWIARGFCARSRYPARGQMQPSPRSRYPSSPTVPTWRNYIECRTERLRLQNAREVLKK